MIKNVKNPMLLDAGESSIFENQLKYTKANTYNKPMKPLKALRLLPVSMEASNVADEIAYKSWDGVALMKYISSYSDELPQADVWAEEKKQKVRAFGGMISYSIQEIRQSQALGTGLDQKKMDYLRRSADQVLDETAWMGDPDTDLKGFLNHENITQYIIPNGALGDTEWTTKTPDEIIADMNGIVTGVIESTNEVEAPDTMLLPIAQYQLIANTRMTGDSNRTILRFFLENSAYIKTIETLTYLKNFNGSGVDRMMVYENSADKLTLEITQPFEIFGAQQEGLVFKVPAHMRTAGVIVYYPASIAYADGI